MFKKVLVPTDGSEAALHAAETVAAHLASVSDAHVTLLVVIAPMDWTLTDFDADFVGERNKKMRANAERVLDRTAGIFTRLGVSTTSKIVEGNSVSAAIAGEASTGKYDLIAMSSRGAGRQADSLRYLGSVTDHVIRRVSTPILVTPAPEDD